MLLNWFWLSIPVMYSLIGSVTSLTCYLCDGQRDCNPVTRKYSCEQDQDPDPNHVCFVIYLRHTNIVDMAGCGSRDFIAKMNVTDGDDGDCKEIEGSRIRDAMIMAEKEMRTRPIRLNWDPVSKHKACACSDKDECSASHFNEIDIRPEDDYIPDDSWMLKRPKNATKKQESTTVVASAGMQRSPSSVLGMGIVIRVVHMLVWNLKVSRSGPFSLKRV